MEVRNCRSCGKLYNYIGPSTPVCPACMKAMDEKYEQVKKYIYDNPRCNINQVAEDNEVSVQQIQRWVREERLSFSEDSDIGIECENCGKMIKTGRFCNDCKAKLKMDINGALPVKQVQVQKKVRESARMRFLDN
ncbi:MAG: flagellar protein [Lachnospiraceae bacterium]|nr:flagellar protein [Lachnospiraceae bacterium]MBP5184327.1 flagellar protein [Lachnospiraceae bacterium]